MSISPFGARPLIPASSTPESERRRARLVTAICVLGIAAALLAYSIAPGVRHAVHSVKHAVSHVFDPDESSAPARQHLAHPAGPVRASHDATKATRHAGAAQAP